MALFIGNTLAKSGIFNTADAEAAFHPWWETVQDYVCYSAILIGNLRKQSRLRPTLLTVKKLFGRYCVYRSKLTILVVIF